MDCSGSDLYHVGVGSAKNTAIVMIEAVIPDHGAREGDTMDIRVTAFAAKSLKGGQLIPTSIRCDTGVPDASSSTVI